VFFVALLHQNSIESSGVFVLHLSAVQLRTLKQCQHMSNDHTVVNAAGARGVHKGDADSQLAGL
jgi:hypothetical protein